MKKILVYFINPYVLSGILTIFIIFCSPNYFTKYKVELVKKDFLERTDTKVFYEDLDGDQVSERILTYYNVSGDACYEVRNELMEVLGQWNFIGEFPRNESNLFIEDIDRNGFKEIYLFSITNDSLFLNINEPLLENGIDRRNIFIDTIGNYNGDQAVFAGIPNFVLNKNNQKEVFFSVSAGFEQFPRGIYKYNYFQNKVYKTGHLTNYQSIYNISNDKDLNKKILACNSFAAGNKIDSIYTDKSDESCWLTILDEDLNFVFEQKEYKLPYYSIKVVSISKSGDEYFVCLANSNNDKEVKDKLDLYSLDGKLIKSIELPFGDYRDIWIDKKNRIQIFQRYKGKLLVFDTEFNRIEEKELNQNAVCWPIDVDDDGVNEWLNVSRDLKSFTIYRNDFSSPVDFAVDSDHSNGIYYGIQQSFEDSTNFYITKNEEVFIFNYSKNKLFHLKYLAYLSVYGAILFLFSLIVKWQKIRDRKKQLIEKEITELQLKTIKNQVDPHFVFNAINTISSLRITDDKIKEDEFICSFSDLLRSTLRNSDSITCTLKEELDFITNYVNLQLIQFDYRFNYHLHIQDGIKTDIIIPKHIIYSHVENAFKHGLAGNESGILKVTISKELKMLKVEIENSGNGLKTTFNEKISTGNGLKILEQIYQLYFKLYKKKISHTVTEVFNKENKPIGVKVTVLIEV